MPTAVIHQAAKNSNMELLKFILIALISLSSCAQKNQSKDQRLDCLELKDSVDITNTIYNQLKYKNYDALFSDESKKIDKVAINRLKKKIFAENENLTISYNKENSIEACPRMTISFLFSEVYDDGEEEYVLEEAIILVVVKKGKEIKIEEAQSAG